MNRLADLMLTSALLATLIACGPSDSLTSPDEAVEQPTGEWALQSFQLADGSHLGVPDPSSYTLELREDPGATDAARAHIRADCNVCGGGYELSGSTLVLGPTACTVAACPPGSLDSDYLSALSSTSTYRRSGDTLALTYDGGVLHFRTP